MFFFSPLRLSLNHCEAAAAGCSCATDPVERQRKDFLFWSLVHVVQVLSINSCFVTSAKNSNAVLYWHVYIYIQYMQIYINWWLMNGLWHSPTLCSFSLLYYMSENAMKKCVVVLIFLIFLFVKPAALTEHVCGQAWFTSSERSCQHLLDLCACICGVYLRPEQLIPPLPTHLQHEYFKDRS